LQVPAVAGAVSLKFKATLAPAATGLARSTRFDVFLLPRFWVNVTGGTGGDMKNKTSVSMDLLTALVLCSTSGWAQHVKITRHFLRGAGT
jgi:hypothetical protein